MKRLVVVLSRDHVGKRWSPRDRGAAVDTDGDGTVEPHEHEAFYAGIYAVHLEAWLTAYGHQVFMVSDDGGEGPRYKARQARADAMGADLYLPCHLNALKGRITPSSGTYGSFFYHHQTTNRPRPNGMHYAVGVRDALREACPELEKVHAYAASPTQWKRAYSTQSHTKAISVTLEPFFLDQTAHQPLLHDPSRVAHAIAFGIHRTANPDAEPLRSLAAPSSTFA